MSVNTLAHTHKQNRHEAQQACPGGNIKSTLPPKFKTLTRDWKRSFSDLRRVSKVLRSASLNVWNWLQSQAHGWRFSVEQIAEGLGMTKSCVYRARAALVSSGFLSVTDDAWAVTNPQLVLGGTSDESATTRARPIPKKREPNSLKKTKPSERVKHDDFERAMTRPLTAPNEGQRKLLPREQQQRPFDVAKRITEITGRHDHNMDRPIWIARYWTREEFEAACQATAKADRPSWRYLCKVLENTGIPKPKPQVTVKSANASGYVPPVFDPAKYQAEEAPNPYWMSDQLELWASQGREVPTFFVDVINEYRAKHNGDDPPMRNGVTCEV